MSVWQNFKDTDHEFEKKFFGVLILVAIGLAIFYLTDLGLSKIPDFKYLFVNNANSFWIFILTLIGISFITEIIYSKSLVGYNEETKKSLCPILFKNMLFTIYWFVWSLFCAWLTLTYKPLTILVLVAILFLTFIPGFLCFFVSRRTRNDDIKTEKEIKNGSNEGIYYPIIIYTDKKYYSGYYGLICLPIYLIVLLIGHML